MQEILGSSHHKKDKRRYLYERTWGKNPLSGSFPLLIPGMTSVLSWGQALCMASLTESKGFLSKSNLLIEEG